MILNFLQSYHNTTKKVKSYETRRFNVKAKCFSLKEGHPSNGCMRLTAHADFTYRFRHFPNSRLVSNTALINSSNRSVKKKEKEEKPEKEKVIISFPLPSLPCVTQQLTISANGGRRHEDGVCRIHSRMP